MATEEDKWVANFERHAPQFRRDHRRDMETMMAIAYRDNDTSDVRSRDYVLVPREPTEAMLKAGCVCLDKASARDKMMAAEMSNAPHAIARAKMRLRWSAMIAAATNGHG